MLNLWMLSIMKQWQQCKNAGEIDSIQIKDDLFFFAD